MELDKISNPLFSKTVKTGAGNRANTPDFYDTLKMQFQASLSGLGPSGIDGVLQPVRDQGPSNQLPQISSLI
ncbi:MAG: hypothetical protein WC624_00135 [Candidatus Margulisiibacteriota bacterium]